MQERKYDNALMEIRRAQELDPLSPPISHLVAVAYYLKNDLAASIAQEQKVVELDPGFPRAHEGLGSAYLRQQRYELATAEFRKAVELAGRASTYLSALGYCYGVTGKPAEALGIVRELEQRHARRDPIGLWIAAVHSGLGEKDKAFEWLEKDFRRHSSQLPDITWLAYFAGLREDPRFADLLRRMGLNP